MLVRNAMHTSSVTIDAQDSLSQATVMMQTLRVRRLLVMSDGALVGLITDGQVARALPQPSDRRTPWEIICLANTLRVSEIMRREVFTTRPDDDLRQAIQILLDRHVGGLPVLYQDGTLVGILTLTDVLRAAATIGLGHVPPDWDTSGWDPAAWGTVRQHMSGDPVTVSLDLPLSEAAARLIATRLRVLPVTQGGTLLGVVHLQDIKAAIGHQEAAQGTVLHGPSSLDHHLSLEGKTVRDLMCFPGAEVLADAPMTEAVRAMLATDVHGLPVMEGDPHEFLGVITVSDVLRALQTGSQSRMKSREAKPA